MSLRIRKSRREMLLGSKAALDGLADLMGKPRMEFISEIPNAPKPRPPKDPGTVYEADVNRAIAAWAKKTPRLKLWRNSRGTAELPNGGRFTFGVGPAGAADWLGYRTVVITDEMVGRHVPVFLAIEAKRPGEDPTEDQYKFLTEIQFDGGLSGCARSADDCERIAFAAKIGR